MEKLVREKIVEGVLGVKPLEDWSPEQISGYAKKHNLFRLAMSVFTNPFYKDKESGGKLYTQLRHQKKYRKRYGSQKRQGPIKNKRFIEERPEIVDKKEKIGER